MKIKDIFSSRKIIPGFLKNFFGLQIIRLSISYLIIKISKNLLNSKKQNFFKKQLYNEGYFIKEFLKKDELKRLKDICDEEMIYAISKKKGYMKELIVTKEILRKRDSKLISFVKDLKIKELFEDFEGHKINFCKMNISIEKTTFGKIEDYDENREWHVDTFYSIYKAWIPLTKISDENFPMKYVPKSHKIGIRRLIDEWIWSFTFKKSDLYLKIAKNISNRSRRSAKNKTLFLDKKAINLKANSGDLIFADTSGLHRRGEGKFGEKRYWIRIDYTRSPFDLKIN